MRKFFIFLITSLSIGLTVGWTQQAFPTDSSFCVLPQEVVPLPEFYGVWEKNHLWPDNVVPYEIETSEFIARELARIDSTIAYINEATNLCLLPRTFEENYLNVAFDPTYSSASSIGFAWRRHEIELSFNASRRTLLHAFGHIFGLHHEHQRPDRDEYLDIFFGNIRPETLNNFDRYSADIPNWYWSETYDFNSVMHYLPYASSRNGLPTIQPLDSGVVIPSNDFFSPADLATLAKLYPQPVDCDSVYRERLPEGSIEVVDLPGEVCRSPIVEVRFVSTHADLANWQFTWEMESGGEVVRSNGSNAQIRLTESGRQVIRVHIRRGVYERTFEDFILVAGSEPQLTVLGNPTTGERIDYRFTSDNEEVAIWFMDAVGRKLYSETLTVSGCGAEGSISCAECPAGVYMLALLDGKQWVTRRVTIVR